MITKLTEIRTGGNTLSALKISDNLCSVVTTLNEIEQFGLMRPTKNASATAKDLKNDDLWARQHSLRETVQRRFDVSRRRRSQSYAEYLANIMMNNRLGGVPPITLYCSNQCQYHEGTLVLPYRSTLVNTDGETQTEARFILRDKVPESGSWSIAAQIYHGITEQHASQILHDFNCYAHPITESVAAVLNSQGQMNKFIEEFFESQGITPNLINRHGTVPKKGQLFAYRALISGIVGAVGGFRGLETIGKKIALLNNGGDSRMIEVARPYLEHVFSLIKRDPAIASDPPVIFGLFGAISHDCGVLVSLEQWIAGSHTYKQFKSEDSPKRGKGAVIPKQNAVLALLSLTRK